MSNTPKALVALITLILVTTIGIFSYNTINPKQSQNTPSQTSLINSVSQNSTSNLSKSSLQSSLSSINNSSQVVASAKCNLPESENLVKTEDGCFEFFIGGKTISQVPISSKEIDSLNLQYIEISKLFYRDIKNKFLSSKHKISADGTNKINENSFEITLGMLDDTYIKNTFGEVGTDNVEINLTTYNITKNNSNEWVYSIKK